ncbi:hypothetical protein EUGRSUZ_A00396 [Eucalyptus grandis]|uniref:Uncharacterized protein n=2 Tax=Eucalyptus grandis TaxID=71139 RepID=A0ACC3M0S0_EUCGR|nr:hypothetical protein EUGRSUZ_A00396 [Eucalyptus grandis]
MNTSASKSEDQRAHLSCARYDRTMVPTSRRSLAGKLVMSHDKGHKISTNVVTPRDPRFPPRLRKNMVHLKPREHGSHLPFDQVDLTSSKGAWMRAHAEPTRS